MSIDKYATAISRSYWITLGLCATAFIVSTGYDEAGRYKEAIAELTALPNIVTGPKVYRELKERTRETIAVPLANSLVKAAGGNFRTDVNMLLANMDYALVDDGPQAFNFRSSPSEAIRLADEVLSNKVYTLRIPKRGYDSPELSLALRLQAA